ncbi:hypothetical protein AAE478_005329 [Parahypoxylon ruwenzoriense]
MARIWYRTFGNCFSIRRLWLFPLLAGFFWFLTLTILLILWLAIGRPQYPGQEKPTIPFISSIAAHQFKPVFIVGCVATGFGYLGTVFAVHYVRYAPQFYGLIDDAPWRQTTSLVALMASFVAAVSLILLSIFDTEDAPARHRQLLMGTFGGLSISAIATVAVWSDQIWGSTRFAGLQKWFIFNTFLVLCEFGTGFAFVILMDEDYFNSSGIFEWCLTYLGSLWLISFVGYTKFREDEDSSFNDEDEQQPLLV